MWQTRMRQAQRLDLGLPRQIVLPDRQVGVAQHRRDRGYRPQSREYVQASDVAGVHDVLGAGQQIVESPRRSSRAVSLTTPMKGGRSSESLPRG